MKSFAWQILLDWFDKNGKHDFPWRQYETNKSDCYKIWLAEILLQQTQADRVVSFYNRILEKFPTIHDLAQSTYEEFFPFYQWLGYYSRARNLIKTAKIITQEYQGVFPRDKTLLKRLPGIGEYTARAILAFGYGKTTLAWDTNLETIFSRYYKWWKNITLHQDEKNRIEEDLHNFLKNKKNPKEEIRNINNALMDWARISEPKNSSLLDTKDYIFKESEFYISKWENELISKKITSYFPIPDAHIIVTLHQDHKIYYSCMNHTYSHFVLEPSENRDTRKYVQGYFREKYGLELSVRPIHRKWISEEGRAYINVNAQVQTWNIPFSKWNKKWESIK